MFVQYFRMTGIINYNAGNIKSVERACKAIGAEYVISKNPSELKRADRLIFPGVGEARYAMGQLKKTGFGDFIKDKVAEGIPLLGICLGAQIVFDFSEEGGVRCLGLIPGEIKRFPQEITGAGLKIPHMGWNSVSLTRTDPRPPQNADRRQTEPALFAGIKDGTDFYFVHSYYMAPEDGNCVTAFADYGAPFAAAVKKGCVQAVQFHPEKSGAPGLRMLANFTRADAESSRREIANADLTADGTGTGAEEQARNARERKC